MARTTKPPAVQSHPSSALVESTPAEEAFAQYSGERDLIMGTPFAKNTALAKSGTPFTILAATKRVFVDTDEKSETVGEMKTRVAYLVRLQDGYVWEDKNGKATQFASGMLQVIALDANPTREADMANVTDILRKFPDGIPNCAAQEYPTSKKAMSNPIGIVSRSAWKPVGDLARERGLA